MGRRWLLRRLGSISGSWSCYRTFWRSRTFGRQRTIRWSRTWTSTRSSKLDLILSLHLGWSWLSSLSLSRICSHLWLHRLSWLTTRRFVRISHYCSTRWFIWWNTLPSWIRLVYLIIINFCTYVISHLLSSIAWCSTGPKKRVVICNSHRIRVLPGHSCMCFASKRISMVNLIVLIVSLIKICSLFWILVCGIGYWNKWGRSRIWLAIHAPWSHWSSHHRTTLSALIHILRFVTCTHFFKYTLFPCQMITCER